MRWLAVALAVAALAGCSHGPTTKEFVSRVNSVCAAEGAWDGTLVHGSAASVRAATPAGTPAHPLSPVEVVRELPVVAQLAGRAAAIEATARKLHEIRPPAAAKDRYRRFLAVRDARLADFHAMKQAWDVADRTSSATAVVAFRRNDDRATALVEPLGIAC